MSILYATMKMLMPAKTPRKRVANRASARKQSSSTGIDVRRVGIGIIALACLPFVAMLVLVGLFLLVPFFASDLSAPELVIVHSALIAGTLGLVHILYAKKQQKRQRVKVLGMTLFASIIGVLALSYFTVPVYQQYRAAYVPSVMEEYLEKKYHEDFIIEKGVYKTPEYFGDSRGVSATAYLANDPDSRFTISEDYGGFSEDFLKKYGKKVEHTISTNLAAKFNTLFGGRLIVKRVSYAGGRSQDILLNNTIMVYINEPFTQDNWQEIKTILRQSAAITNESLYQSYNYYFSVTNTPDVISYEADPKEFNCMITPSQKNGELLDRAIAECERDYNERNAKELN